MGIRKQKPGSGPAGPAPGQHRARRDYVEEVQRRARQLKERVEKATKKDGEDDAAGQRQRQIQRHMAQLRSDAVQARRLAEQIDNLSQQATAGKRKRTMTNTPTMEPGHSPGLTRRSSDKPAGAGSQSNFNPLHPSMELPPEQLIRLLGLEDKKSRKKRKPSAPAQTEPTTVHDRGEQTDEPLATMTTERRAPDASRAASGSSRSMQRRQKEQTRATLFEETRRKLLLPAIGFGLVAGIAVSVLLLRGQPEPLTTSEAKSAVSGTPVPASRPAAVIRKPVPTTPADRPVANGKVGTAAPVAASNPKWQAAIRVQEQRLRDAAQQRLDQRILQASQSASAAAPEATLATPPVSAPTAAQPAEPLPPAPNDTDYPVQDGEAPLISVSEPLPPGEIAPPQPAPEPVPGDLPSAQSTPGSGISDSGTPAAPVNNSPTLDTAPTAAPLVPPMESGGNEEKAESLPVNDAPTVEPAVTDSPMDAVTAVETPLETTSTGGIPTEPYSVDMPASAAGSTGAPGD